MKRYYVANPEAERGFEELTEAEWLSLVGDDATRPYTNKVYRGEISIEDVPEEVRESVQTIVNNKIERWGTYGNRNVSSIELQTMIEGVL